MAQESHHDVVTQSQSADVPTFVDASAAQTTDSAARAAVEQSPVSRLQSSANQAGTPSDQHQDANPSSQDANQAEKQDPIVKSENQDASTTLNVTTNGIVDSAESRDGKNDEDESARSTGVDGSIGSDTDTGKADAAGTATKDSEGRDPIPRYAAKKSASFKPVSVTKNFLARAGSISTPSKPGSGNENANVIPGTSPGPAAQMIARPRLVAKSASGQRGVAPKMTDTALKSGKGSGPDPNQVWNKNRVSTPQATPKHLTDEELRIQYGIQLASRPQEDGDGKEAKWADIDDDEDDWAPETIEWNDGTKINLAQVERDAAAAEELAAQKAKEAQEKEADALKAKESMSKPSVVGPNATVLKLGSSAHNKPPSATNKNNSDKPTLVAKPVAPAAVKSPWAPLPAVDKVPPVQINPQAQPSQSRFGNKDPHGFDAMPPPPAHQAKEIAADDFSRFSRDSSNGVPKELFVPQSGRYEPVNDSRRQSFRRDGNYRQPSLLQRPSQVDQHGPAEPSAAFQTHRSQQDSVSWTRRRASSTVSGDSGNIGRRMSIGRSLESPRVAGEAQPRRDSQHEQSHAAPSMGSTMGSQRGASPAQSHGRSIASPSPTALVAPDAGPDAAPGAEQQGANTVQKAPLQSNATTEDAVTVQKRLMREKREAAIKRKKDEEEREEAERRERIRLKLEKLGYLDDKPEKKGHAESAAGTSKASTKDSKDARPKVPESPPKPPVPNATGLPQQYGLMKVHASQPANVVSPVSVLSGEKTAAAAAMAVPQSDKALEESADTHTALVNGKTKPQEKETRTSERDANAQAKENENAVKHELLGKDATAETRQWSNLQQQASGPYPSWGTSSMTTHSSPGGNLWGPPSNHRALGNGDFQQNLQRTSLRPSQPPYTQHLTSSTTPQPIGTPRQHQQSRGLPPQLKPDSLARSLIEDSQTIPAYPSPEPDPLPIGNHKRAEQQPTNNRKIEQPVLQTNAPTSKMTEPVLDKPATGVAAWANFGANVARQEAEEAAKAQAARMTAKQLGLDKPPQLPTFHETWKQVKRDETTGARQVVATVRATTSYAPSVPSAPQAPPAVLPPTMGVPSAAPHVRSRYQDIFEQNQRAVSVPPALLRPRSPSAPPPDSLDHPAYLGVNTRPLVNLPGSRPKLPEKPVVKLPPAKVSPESQRAPVVVDSRGPSSANRAASQPLNSNPSWQDRFNGLFGRELSTSPEKKFVNIADFSASKEPLELSLPGGAKAVTLPPLDDSRAAVRYMLVKAVEDEDALFEERDFGSVPITRIPAMAPVSAWQPAREPIHLQKRAKTLALKDTDVQSIPYGLNIHEEQFRANGFQITILLRGMTAPKTKAISRGTVHGASRLQKAPAKRGNHRQVHKPRDASSPQTARPVQGGVGRGQSQSGTSPKPKPSQGGGSTSWARKASGVAA